MKHKSYVPLPTYMVKKKERILGLNSYQRLHYWLLNQCKIQYREKLGDWHEALPKFKTLKIKYTIFFKTARKKDLDNYTAPLHKFMCDYLVENGVIPEDDYTIVTEFSSKFGGIDDNYALVELEGEELGTE